MKIDLKKFAKTIEDIDHGCGGCVTSFMQDLKAIIESDDFETIMGHLEATENYWAKELRWDLQ